MDRNSNGISLGAKINFMFKNKLSVWQKVLIVGGSILVLSVAILIAIIAIINSFSIQSITPVDVTQINYNNYSNSLYGEFNGSIDCDENGKIYVQEPVSKNVSCLSDNTLFAENVGLPFQIFNNSVYFIRHAEEANDCKMYCQKSDGTIESAVRDNVRSFVVCDDGILYLTAYKMQDGRLSYNLAFNSAAEDEMQMVGNDVIWFIYCEDYVYYIDDSYNVHSSQLSTEKKNILGKLSELKYDSTTIIGQKIGNMLLIGSSVRDELQTFNLETGEVNQLAPDSMYSQTAMISDGENTYISFHAFTYNQSKNNDENQLKVFSNNSINGLWKINIETGIKEKISDTCFSELHMYDKNSIFGVSTNNIYQINTATKAQKRIA